MKGIILAGGNGTRLNPLTLVSNKHLLPVYDKPMIFYPIETLKKLGVDDILIISGGEHIGRFMELLGDGSDFGVKFTYRVQKKAGGIAEALGLAEDFSNKESIAVILGDNIFENEKLPNDTFPDDNAVLLFASVEDPQRFGVPVITDRVIKIEEKPKHPQSDYAVTGLYYYPNDVFEIIKTLKPSERGELEITDLNNFYINQNKCSYNIFKGFWSDAGTFKSLLKSSNWVKSKL